MNHFFKNPFYPVLRFYTPENVKEALGFRRFQGA